MQIEFNVLADLSADSDAADVSENRKAAQPRENFPALPSGLRAGGSRGAGIGDAVLERGGAGAHGISIRTITK
jgi:hypothetical protein